MEAAIQINTGCVCSLEFRVSLTTVSRKCLVASSFYEKHLSIPDWSVELRNSFKFTTEQKSSYSLDLIRHYSVAIMVTSWAAFLHTFLLCGEEKSLTGAFVRHLKKYPYRIAEHFPNYIKTSYLGIPGVELNRNLEPSLNILMNYFKVSSIQILNQKL